VREALEQIRKYCDENLGPSRSSLLNKIAALADAALSTTAIGTPDETDDEIDERLAKQESRDNLRLLDYIADKIGLPHNQELSQENFNAWLAIGAREALDGETVQTLLDLLKPLQARQALLNAAAARTRHT
jgi:hypothetical protein